MKNCLVTTLRGGVNKELPLLGKVKVVVSNNPNADNATQKLRLMDTYGDESFKCEIIGDGYFKDTYSGPSIGKTTILNSSNNSVYCSNPDSGNYSIIIDNAYKIQWIKGILCYVNFEMVPSLSDINTVDANQSSGSYSVMRNNIKNIKGWDSLQVFKCDSCPNLEGDISAFSDKESMTELLLFDTKCEGDVTTLRNLTSLTKINLRYNPIDKTKIYGDIATAFGGMINLSQLFVFQNTNVSGSIENLVKAWVSNGKAYGSVSSRTYSNSESKVTFNGSPLPSSGNTTIVWAPNTDPTKTDITVNGTTVTIDNES